ncbi:MAG: response regulator transcription factor [Acidobacteria bacterium]|nr:response regulator transcription factor [Acidobacteriota bacterium]
MPEIVDQTIHILLLDDHTLFRESITRLLSSEPGFDVAAHCGTVEEALTVLRQKSIDIILLDFDLGDRDGREFISLARAQGFKGKILVVTAGLDQPAMSELVRSGVAGIFRKHDSAGLLAQGIREVVSGKVWLRQEQLEVALRNHSKSSKSMVSPFTERERQVLSCVFEGLANKEIAGRIGVSEGSIKATLQQLFSKTGVRTRSQLVRSVLEHYRDQL